MAGDRPERMIKTVDGRPRLQGRRNKLVYISPRVTPTPNRGLGTSDKRESFVFVVLYCLEALTLPLKLLRRMQLLLNGSPSAPALLFPVSKPAAGADFLSRAGHFASRPVAVSLNHQKFPCFSPVCTPRREHAARLIARAGSTEVSTADRDVLKALSQIIDPDFGTDIVSCGFVKDLSADAISGEVSFRLELTTPACPVKDMFETRANEVVSELPWVKKLKVTMSAQPARPIYADQLPKGLQSISNIVAVSSCKGGVGKSTVAVNLAYTLAGMGARVGIFDADVYGPSLPTMVSPEVRVLEMNPETKAIIPTEYLGVKMVSFGFAGQGRAIMRGPMVSGVINQLLTTSEWGELDYLIIDMPPGTGDIHLTLCQVVPLTAAVIVTTPQKLSFIDVAKGVRMFSTLKVPCIAVVENMCYFDADGKRYHPFGVGSGSQVVQQFGIPHLFDLPIRPSLSACGDNGMPEVVSNPVGEVSRIFQDLGVCVVQQCAKIRQIVSTAVSYDRSLKAIRVKVPNTKEEFLLHPATVRRNDRSAQSIDEWTGEQKLQYGDIPENIEPVEIRPMGNYAVSITWPDGFSQIAPYDQLQTMERLVDVPETVTSRAAA
ncbi:ATP binding protein [Wolffia australiana]